MVGFGEVFGEVFLVLVLVVWVCWCWFSTFGIVFFVFVLGLGLVGFGGLVGRLKYFFLQIMI